MRWNWDLAAEVEEQIKSVDWSILPELEATKAVRMSTELRLGSRPKTEDTLVEKLQRRATLTLEN